MKFTWQKGALIVLVIIVVCLLVLPHVARNLLDSHQTPEQQLNQLRLQTTAQAREIMGSHQYTFEDAGGSCRNEGESEFFAYGRDTIACTYSASINSPLSGKELRKLIESAGWKRHLYDDGSGADFRNKDAPICTVWDGNTYHSRKAAEETYVDNFFAINCQSFTDHYNSPLPPPSNNP